MGPLENKGFVVVENKVFMDVFSEATICTQTKCKDLIKVNIWSYEKTILDTKSGYHYQLHVI